MTLVQIAKLLIQMDHVESAHKALLSFLIHSVQVVMQIVVWIEVVCDLIVILLGYSHQMVTALIKMAQSSL